MALVDVIALVIGLGIAIAAARLARSVVSNPDESMRFEGGVAVGFTALIALGPFWVAQLVLTIIATKHDGGIPAGWLWAWLVVAPLVGVSWGGRAR